MTTALRFRLFRAGRYPTGWAELGADPEVLLAAEGVPVTSTFTGLKLPGRSTNSGVRKLVGSLVLTPERLRASIGSLVVLDCPLGDPATAGAVLQLFLEPAGPRIRVDVAGLVPAGRGVTDLRWAAPLRPAVLARLPALSGTPHVDAITAQRLSRKL